MPSLKTTPLLVDISHITLHLTRKEFERLCQDNPEVRFELTATGELEIMPPVGWTSSRKNGDLFGQIWMWNCQNKLGEVFDSSGGFTLPNGAVRSPDVTWIEGSKLKNISADITFPAVVPDFVIELRSATDSLTKLQNKMVEYRDNGVRLGWLINPQQQQVEIYRLGREVETLQSPPSLSGEDVLVEFTLNLITIW
jgi:Uma2 family endonuclease